MQSKFKVGDKVKVISQYLSQDDIGSDYPCWFTTQMRHSFAGKTMTISKVQRTSAYRNAKYFEEPYYYEVEENSYFWASPMFVQDKVNISIF